MMGWLFDYYYGVKPVEVNAYEDDQPTLPLDFHESLDPIAECDCRCGQTAHPMDMYLDRELNMLFISETHREEYVDELFRRISESQ